MADFYLAIDITVDGDNNDSNDNNSVDGDNNNGNNES